MLRTLFLMLAISFIGIAQQADAAAVRFRGNIGEFSPGLTANGGTDPLGLSPLGSTTFEAVVQTNNLGTIQSGYIVFLGTYYNFATGTVNTVPTNPTTFSGMQLLTSQNAATGQTLAISIPTAGADGDFSSLIGVAGSFQITGGGLQYFGNITAVPEPGSMLALTGLVLGAGAYRRRSLKKKAAA